VRTGRGAAVGVVTEGVDVEAALGVGVVAGEVPGDGGGSRLGRLLEHDRAGDLGVTTEDSDYRTTPPKGGGRLSVSNRRVLVLWRSPRIACRRRMSWPRRAEEVASWAGPNVKDATGVTEVTVQKPAQTSSGRAKYKEKSVPCAPLFSLLSPIDGGVCVDLPALTILTVIWFLWKWYDRDTVDTGEDEEEERRRRREEWRE
jgi:hypothetical protein